jgi:tetratricopeptide (TPR) repeat protein
MRRVILLLSVSNFLVLDFSSPLAAIDSNNAVSARKSAEVLNDRGEDLRKKGDFDGAIKEFTDAIQLDPQFSWPYNNRGLARTAKGEFEQALSDYDEAIRLDANYAFAFNNRGLVWTAKGELDKALKDYAEAIRINPKYVFPYYNRGIVWVRKEDFGKAIGDFAEAIQLDPQFPAPNNEIAWIRATCPDPEFRAGEEAIRFATRACELTGWKSYAELDTLAAAYAEAGEFTNAVIWQMTAVEKAPDKQKQSVSERLELYRSNQPFHQKSKLP